MLLLLSECLEFFEDLGTYYLLDNEKLLLLIGSVRAFSPADKTETEIKDFILKLTEKLETKDNRWETGWEQFLNKLFVTEIYGYFRNRFKSFDSHWETLFLRYCEK